MSFKILCLVSFLLCAGCAQKERGGDITLASQASLPATATGSNNMSTSSASASRAPASSNSGSAGSGLRTGYGTAVDMGASGVAPSSPSARSSDSVSPASESTYAIPPPAASTPRSVPEPKSVNMANPVTPPNPVNPADAAAVAQSGPVIANAANSSSSVIASNSKLPARIVTIARTKPDCKGDDCPSILVKRLSFTGRERFNAFLDQTMASMAEVDASNIAPFRNLAEFAGYFWKVAKPRYEVVLEASIRRGDEDLVVVQLDSYIFTGGAHGVSTSQYINWLPTVDKILSLESMLLPNRMPAFEAALKRQHAAWLLTNPQAVQNQAAYAKLWPFVPTDNAALLKEGLTVTYDPYMIAPYSFGKPTLVIPYGELKGILRPEVLPK